MQNILIGLLSGVVLGGVVFFMFRKKETPQTEPEKDTGLQLILAQLHELTRTVDTKILESQRSVNDSLRYQTSETRQIIQDVTERLARLDETNRQVIGFSEQIKNLQDMLKNPKQRGVLGEYYLETLLKNILPPGNYQMQYAFKNNEVVDAALFVKDKIIPVDSKFSLENYNRLTEAHDPLERERLEKLFVNDLKLRIQETAKYIKPNENTMDFAFMFIPHEAIYYDLLINKVGGLMEENENLIQRAAHKYKVIIVSPTSFLAYLQTVLQGLKAMQIEESAKDIVKRVGELGKHLKSYEEYHQKLGKSLETTVNHFNAGGKEFKKIDKDITRIVGISPELATVLLEKPKEEEE